MTDRLASICAGVVVVTWAASGRILAQGDSPGAEDIRDIMVRRPPPSPLPWILWSIAIGFILLALFFGLRWFLRRHRPQPLGPPPEAVARERLSAIRAQVEELAPNRASLEISETLKDFLSARYRDPIRYETAEEYLNRMMQARHDATANRLRPELLEEVRSFISISEQLKFARLNEARSHVPALIEQAERIVESATADPAESGR